MEKGKDSGSQEVKCMYNHLNFRPAWGLSSAHLQTILPVFMSDGFSPPSEEMIVKLADGDSLNCVVSFADSTKSPKKIVVMVHGMGGSYRSGYLIRLARKTYQAGYMAVRLNLRNCGTGAGLANKPYNGGTSQDVLDVLKILRKRFSNAEIVLVGFSLGGNVVLKLAGELSAQATQFIDQLIAVCPTLDLYHSVQYIQAPGHKLYHQYYLKHLLQQCKKWIGSENIQSIYEFDDKITAPLWGYKDARDYYTQCSAGGFINKISITTQILFAEDDPFIDCHILDYVKLPSNVKISVTSHGGHMGFLGWAGKEHGYRWLDSWVMKMIQEGKVI